MGDLSHIAENLRGLATPVAELHADPANARTGHDVRRIAESLKAYGQRKPLVANRAQGGKVEAGNGTLAAALSLGWTHVAVVWVDDDPATAAAFGIADNRTGELSRWDAEALGALADVTQGLFTAFTGDELAEVLGVKPAGTADAEPQVDRAEELRVKWGVEPGDLWRVGEHRLICGDCREPATWDRLLSGVKVNGVFTSPPYAEQRTEQYGGTPTNEYVAWWEAVQANVKANLAADGSFFVNIKPHCEDGERVLYVFDLVLAMRRQWGWRFVDELCWRNQGMPGLYGDRLKNQFEPIYHFSENKCKTRFEHVQHDSKDVPTASRGSNAKMQGIADPFTQRGTGRAFPGNVIEVTSAIGGNYELGHAAAFPVFIPDFFIRAYSDAGDVWIDPFCGSGTTLVAAHNNKRIGMGIEMLPKYCAVILERMATAFPGIVIERVGDG